MPDAPDKTTLPPVPGPGPLKPLQPSDGWPVIEYATTDLTPSQIAQRRSVEERERRLNQTTRQDDEQYLSSQLRAVYEAGLRRKPMGDTAFLNTAATIISQLDGYAENKHGE